MEDQWFILIKLKQSEQLHFTIKKIVVTIFTDVTVCDNEHICVLIQATVKCAFLKDNSVIL